jgi:hypothetical protein
VWYSLSNPSLKRAYAPARRVLAHRRKRQGKSLFGKRGERARTGLKLRERFTYSELRDHKKRLAEKESLYYTPPKVNFT